MEKIKKHKGLIILVIILMLIVWWQLPPSERRVKQIKDECSKTTLWIMSGPNYAPGGKDFKHYSETYDLYYWGCLGEKGYQKGDKYFEN